MECSAHDAVIFHEAERNYYMKLIDSRLIIRYGQSVEMCLLCESAVTAKERRNLSSESTEHVLPILLELSGALEKNRLLF